MAVPQKVPRYAIEPSADPVLYGSRPTDAPQNAYRGNHLELVPGMATNVGNGGVSQTAIWYQLLVEAAVTAAGGTPRTTPYSPAPETTTP